MKEMLLLPFLGIFSDFYNLPLCLLKTNLSYKMATLTPKQQFAYSLIHLLIKFLTAFGVACFSLELNLLFLIKNDNSNKTV